MHAINRADVRGLELDARTATTRKAASTPTLDSALATLAGDFEDISLRDSLATSISTTPSSPLHYFSDAGSADVSSRDSSSSIGSQLGDDDHTGSTVKADANDPDADSNDLAHKLGGYSLARARNSKSDLALGMGGNGSTTSLAGASAQRPLAGTRHSSASLRGASGPRTSPAIDAGAFRRASTGTTVGSIGSSPSRAPPSDKGPMVPPGPRMGGARKTAPPMLRRALSADIGGRMGPPPPRSRPGGHGATSASASTTNLGSSDVGLGISRPKLRLKTKRLTAQELEMEYDDTEDGDDDLPDYALMFNVPMSPALYAKSRQNSLQRRRSSGGGPSSAGAVPRTPELPRINEGETAQSIAGLETLDEDAQDLTRAYQTHAGARELDDRRISSASANGAGNGAASGSASGPTSRRSSTASAGGSNSRPMSRSASSSSVGSATTPTSATTSFRPSKTRPAYLPPKTPEEERRHQAEYARLCEQVAQAEKKRAAERRAAQDARLAQQRLDEAEWKNRVLPAFDRQKTLPKTREMWWRGIPQQLRERVWKRQIGNRLNIPADAFSRTRADAATAAAIAKDTAHIFTDLHIFAPTSPLHDDLVALVGAYTAYTNTPYRKPLCSIGAVLLLTMPGPDAFVAMCNLLDGSLPRAIATRDDKTVTGHYSSFLKVLNTKFTSLYRHFQSIHLPPSAYLEPLVAPLFAEHLPLDTVMRAWDIYVFEGDAFLLRLALGIMASIEHRLYSDTAAGVLEHLGWNATPVQVPDDDKFFKSVRDILKPSV